MPNEFLPNVNSEVLSTRFAYSNNVAMCSYVPKKKKAVVLISTFHYSPEVEFEKKNKPKMITDYNRLKGGTDSMDKMLSEYTCQRKTNRWTLSFFYNMTDIAALASYIIYKDNWNLTKLKRRMFVKDLALELCRPEIERRRENSYVNRIFTTKSAIEALLGVPIAKNNVVEKTKKSSSNNNRCQLCKDNGNPRKSTRTFCVLCDIPVCKSHKITASLCDNCDFTQNIV